jgi:hypothetical protein
MMTLHFGLSCPLESIREYLTGALAASAMAYSPIVVPGSVLYARNPAIGANGYFGVTSLCAAGPTPATAERTLRISYPWRSQFTYLMSSGAAIGNADARPCDALPGFLFAGVIKFGVSQLDRVNE